MFSGFDNVGKRKRNFKFLSFSVISEGLKLSVPVISIHGGVLKKYLIAYYAKITQYLTAKLSEYLTQHKSFHFLIFLAILNGKGRIKHFFSIKITCFWYDQINMSQVWKERNKEKIIANNIVKELVHSVFYFGQEFKINGIGSQKTIHTLLIIVRL